MSRCSEDDTSCAGISCTIGLDLARPREVASGRKPQRGQSSPAGGGSYAAVGAASTSWSFTTAYGTPSGSSGGSAGHERSALSLV